MVGSPPGDGGDSVAAEEASLLAAREGDGMITPSF
jgi:hypothetical protein